MVDGANVPTEECKLANIPSPEATAARTAQSPSLPQKKEVGFDVCEPTSNSTI